MLLKRKKYSSYVTFPFNIYLVLEMDPYSFMECDQFISLGFLSKFSITCKERDKTRVFLILIFHFFHYWIISWEFTRRDIHLKCTQVRGEQGIRPKALIYCFGDATLSLKCVLGGVCQMFRLLDRTYLDGP